MNRAPAAQVQSARLELQRPEHCQLQQQQEGGCEAGCNCFLLVAGWLKRAG